MYADQHEPDKYFNTLQASSNSKPHLPYALSDKGNCPGIYASRLRNNSERSERLAREREKSVPKDRPPLSPNTTKKKIPKNCKSKTNKVSRSASVCSTRDTRDTPDIRQFLNSDMMGDNNNDISTNNEDENNTPSQKSTPADDQLQQPQLNVNSQFADQGDKDKETNSGAQPIVPGNIKVPAQPATLTVMMAAKEDLIQLKNDEEEIARIQKRIDKADATSMEKLLLEMQLDTKRENLKTRRMMQNMLQQVSQVKGDNESLSCRF